LIDALEKIGAKYIISITSQREEWKDGAGKSEGQKLSGETAGSG